MGILYNAYYKFYKMPTFQTVPATYTCIGKPIINHNLGRLYLQNVNQTTCDVKTISGLAQLLNGNGRGWGRQSAVTNKHAEVGEKPYCIHKTVCWC